MGIPLPLLTCPNLSNEQLIEAYEVNASRLRQAVEGLNGEEFEARPIAGKWSIREIVVHVADTEIMAAGRFRQAITQSEPTFPFWNQEIWAERLGYQEIGEAELEVTLNLYAALRASAAHLLRRLPSEGWSRAGVHQTRGPMTVRQLLEHHTVHGERHLKQILDRRVLLGKPLVMQSLRQVSWR